MIFSIVCIRIQLPSTSGYEAQQKISNGKVAVESQSNTTIRLYAAKLLFLELTV